MSDSTHVDFAALEGVIRHTPIVDTHVHLWDPAHLRYPWLDGIELLNRPYLLEDYQAATSALPVTKMVFLQCDCSPAESLAESQWVSEIAKREPRLQGMVVHAAVERGRAVADELTAYADNPLVKGIRRLLHTNPQEDFCVQPPFIEGVRELANFDLTFDLCANAAKLPYVIELARQCPDVSFILDHIGVPDIAGDSFSVWRDHITDLSRLPNVMCKVSGVATCADHESWTIDDVRPYVLHVIDAFGWDRVAFGGDWPVALLATTYLRWVQTLHTIIADASQTQRRQLFHDNAVRFYRLD